MGDYLRVGHITLARQGRPTWQLKYREATQPSREDDRGRFPTGETISNDRGPVRLFILGLFRRYQQFNRS